MAGILSAIKLTEAGLTDFTVYEKGASVGGTWRENTYPGAACDSPSFLYCYSFAPKIDWSRKSERASTRMTEPLLIVPRAGSALTTNRTGWVP